MQRLFCEISGMLKAIDTYLGTAARHHFVTLGGVRICETIAANEY
jgi:hypothetical protein